MNNLNNKIVDLFKYLLNSGTKYLTEIKHNILCYKINNNVIKLYVDFSTEDKENIENSYTKIDALKNPFDLSLKLYPYINTQDTLVITFNIKVNNKLYTVPKLDRTNHAQALDRLDAIFEEYESNQLDSILNVFKKDSREEL